VIYLGEKNIKIQREREKRERGEREKRGEREREEREREEREKREREKRERYKDQLSHFHPFVIRGGIVCFELGRKGVDWQRTTIFKIKIPPNCLGSEEFLSFNLQRKK